MENPIKDIQYFIDMYFKQYKLEQQNDIKDCLSSFYDDLVDLQKSKICLNQYSREIATLKKNAQTLQRFSSESITLDKLPKHPTEIYFYMSNYLYNTYEIDDEISNDIFKIMLDAILPTKTKQESKESKGRRKPKMTKDIRKKNELFFSACEAALSGETDKIWLKICEDNKGKTLKELKEIFIKDTKLQ